ncbi:hypothetical protein PSECIP111951_04011 [Pseudoalteromonas holothuriae]|uniref:Uncharacterized protein n=2 Tax=Pseudoalteromonas holothuriae TaxID=2963714 RepID=A0A9W4VTV8_9GAMM|nr:hypothetical protein PSECIP111854_03045 [Pseudoalteromonas sp. CIP111854]CAH9068089.1 hypothetical protein PSECIP111951_04011 [Pseudoalteromonas sp. CIP111951]
MEGIVIVRMTQNKKPAFAGLLQNGNQGGINKCLLLLTSIIIDPDNIIKFKTIY